MNPEQWQQLWRHFHRMVTLNTDQRKAELEKLAARDAALAKELKSLLEAEQQADSPLDHPPMLEGRLQAGIRIGAWRLIRELGRGGMGTVWLAERADGAYQQRVAVKLLSPVVISPRIVERFAREREILARLKHPGIAALLDGGTTAAGQPFLVMEHVDGLPLDRYCEQHRLDLAARLELMLQVCAAVDYAHRQLIVHRDLKPANILVTHEGRPVLLDFGIARLLETPLDAQLTVAAERRLTPDYASPEQLRGDPVDTSSDAFSLGVILYQLLAGRRPWKTEGKTLGQAQALVENTRPPLPSRVRARDDQVIAARALRGDLDRIVSKAIEPERSQRYLDARELQRDIRAWLDGFPVQARPPTWRYRLIRFAGRHPLSLGASVSALLLMAVLSVALWQRSLDLAGALDHSHRQAERAELLSGFLEELLAQADPEIHQGRPLTVDEVLEQGVRQVEHGFDRQPELQASLLLTLARIYRHRGEYQRAEAMVEQALTANAGAAPVEAWIELARIHRALGGYARAEAAAERALAVAEDPEQRFQSRLILSEIFGAIGRVDESEQQVEQAITELPAFHPLLADGWMRLAALAWMRGQFGQAEAHYRQALQRYRDHHGESSSRAAGALAGVAAARYRQGDYEQAEGLYRQVIDLRLAIYGENHSRVVESRAHLGALLYDRGDYREAAAMLSQVLARQHDIYGPEAPALANTHNNLALVLAAQGDHKQAEQHFGRALHINRAALGERHARVAGNLGNIGWMQIERGRYDEAMDSLLSALEVQREVLGEEHPQTAFTFHHLGRAALGLGDHAGARHWLEKAMRHRLDAFSPDHPQVAATAFWLGRLALAEGHQEQAAITLRESYENLAGRLGMDDWRTLQSRAWLGVALIGSGCNEQGGEMLTSAVEQLSRLWAPDDDRLLALTATVMNQRLTDACADPAGR